MEDSAIASLIAKYNSTATVGFSFMAVFGWLSVTEIAAIIGAAAALLSFAYDVFNKERQKRRHQKISDETAILAKAENDRAQEAHNIKMEIYRKELEAKGG